MHVLIINFRLVDMDEEGYRARLEAGCDYADVGCGSGRALLKLRAGSRTR